MEPLISLTAVAAPLPAINIDTDQVIPARYLQKPRDTWFGAYLFHDVRRDATGVLRPDFPLNRPAYAPARILVAGRNFGCGSSREQAVWALFDAGVRAVVAPSFGDIFRSNALKNGLLPVVLAPDVVQQLLQALADAPGMSLSISVEQQLLVAPGLRVPFALEAFARQCLLQGLDEIDYTLQLAPQIQAYEIAHGAGQP